MNINFDETLKALKNSDFSYFESSNLRKCGLDKDDVIGEYWIRHIIDIAAPAVVSWFIRSLDSESLNLQCSDGHTLLTACIEREDEYKIDVLRLLIDKGLDIDRPGWQGMPPLIFALEQRDIDSLKVLLEHGAKTNTKATIDSNLSFLDMVKDLDNSTKKKIGL